MIGIPIVAAALAFGTVLLAGKSMGKSREGTDPRSLRLDMAGLRSPADRSAFQMLLLASAIGLATIAGLMAVLQGLPIGGCAAAAALGAAIGWRIPNAWVDARAARRRIEILSELPAMLDLLQISMSGGMGLHAAWSAVSRNLEDGADALAEEMRRIDLDVSFGSGWSAALSKSSDRTGIGELRSLGSLMGQTERFGSDLARTLQVMADSLRQEELQSVEERAHRASVKILFPLAALMLPATLLLIVAPLLLLLFEALMKASA